MQIGLCFLWCSVDASNTQRSVRILLPWLCVVSWLWQVPAAQVSAGQDDRACFRARSFFWTHMLCFVLTGAASTARRSKRQMRRSTWTKVKGPGVWGFCLGCKTWLMFWCSGSERLHSSWGEYVSGFPSCKHSTLKFIYFSNRENKSIWVKWFEGTDRRKVYQIFALFLAAERHLFLATWNLGRIFPCNTLLKQFLNGPEAILQERECELCCLFFSTESFCSFPVPNPGPELRTSGSHRKKGCVLFSQVHDRPLAC